MESLAGRFLSAAKWLSALNVLQTISRFGVGIVLARLIPPSAFGEYAFMLAIVEGMTIVIGFGINTSIIQNNRHREEPFQNSGFFTAAGLTFSYAAVATAAGWLFLPHLFYPYMLLLTGKIIFMLSGGGVEIEVGDGTKRRLGAGDILLAEDTTGRGHISRAIDERPRLSVFVPLA